MDGWMLDVQQSTEFNQENFTLYSKQKTMFEERQHGHDIKRTCLEELHSQRAFSQKY